MHRGRQDGPPGAAWRLEKPGQALPKGRGRWGLGAQPGAFAAVPLAVEPTVGTCEEASLRGPISGDPRS